MIKFEHTEIFGWETAIRGMRNPMNSWHLSDSGCDDFGMFYLGDKDLKLMKNLVKAGSDHAKFMRMINVTVDITSPLYWWKETDQYRIGVVTNSCSTMHKIHAKEFTSYDFSCEHLDDKDGMEINSLAIMETVINYLNIARTLYLQTKDKRYWWQMIQLLPSSYNQRRTVQLNYAVLKNMYHARKHHKLDEWLDFCKWVETLPYSELITE